MSGKSWGEVLDEYDDALISWRELDHSARPRYEALRARIEAALTQPVIAFGDFRRVDTLRCWPAADAGPCTRMVALEVRDGPDAWRVWERVAELGWTSVERGVAPNASRVWRCPEHRPDAAAAS